MAIIIKQFIITGLLIALGLGGASRAVQAPDSTASFPSAAIGISAKNSKTAKVKAQKEKRPGMYGRLTVPSVGVDVALFWADAKSSLAYRQRLTDAKDSACFYRNYPGNEYYYVADHNYQGFSKIKKCTVGKTKMYINDGNTVREYICSYINRNVKRTKSGQIKRTDEMKSAARSNSENVVMYTCNKSDTSITWIVFTPLNQNHRLNRWFEQTL